MAGRAIVSALHLPFPGTVVGIVLLFLALVAIGRVPEPMARTADFALGHLNFLYIPAAVGVVAYASLLGRDAIAITAALIGSALVGMIVSGWTFQLVARGRQKEDRS